MKVSPLIVDSLSKKYLFSNYRAVNEISIEVKDSTMMGILGPNGAGKSTSINILARIIKQDSGQIYYFGNKLKDGDYHYRINVGFVLEKPTYFENLTAREFLEFAGSMYGIPGLALKTRVGELINYFDLTDNQDKRIIQYSSGMKKKVLLAAAIIHNPRLLILDEPFEGIDPISVKKIKDLLKSIIRSGASILISSHALETIEKLCDEIIIINKGRVLCQIKIGDILKTRKRNSTNETYQSLEEIYYDVVSRDNGNYKPEKLSWL